VRNASKIFVLNSEGKKYDTIKVDVKVGLIGWESMDWFHVAHDRVRWRAVVNPVTKYLVS
jgi:hypothetical protein